MHHPTADRPIKHRLGVFLNNVRLLLAQQHQRPVKQRAGTLRYMGPPRPGPLLNRPRGDKCSQRGKPSQANRGPKNLGRSQRLSKN